MRNNHKSIDDLLGIYMVGGAILGIYGISKFIKEAWNYPAVLWMGFVFGGLYILVGVSGYYLFRFQKVKSYTILTQAVQAIGFSTFGIKYQFCAGSSIKIGYQTNNILCKLEPINVEFTLGINPTINFFYVNIVPLIIICYLIYQINQHGLKKV